MCKHPKPSMGRVEVASMSSSFKRRPQIQKPSVLALLDVAVGTGRKAEGRWAYDMETKIDGIFRCEWQ